MATTLEWIMKLADQFSGPAAKIRKSAAGMTGDLRQLQRVSANRTAMRRTLSLGRSAGGPGNTGGGFGTPDWAKVGPAALTAVTAVTTVLAGFGKSVVQAQLFKQDTMTALRTLLKSDAAAQDAFKFAAKTADFIGQSRTETLAQFTTLLGQGFSVQGADEIVRAMADLTTFNPAANLDSIVNAIGKIKATGRLQGDELNMLNEAGLSTDLVYKQLAKTLGKNTDEIKKMQTAGKLSADVTIKAILAAINEQAGGGAAGAAAAAKAVQNTSGLLKRLQAVPSNLFMAMEVTPGMKALNAFLAGIVGYFSLSSESGQRVVAVLEKVFNSFAKGLFGDDALGDAKDGLDGVVELLEKLEASGAFTALGTGLRWVANAVVGLIQLFAWLGSVFEYVALGFQGVDAIFSSLESAVGGLAGEMVTAGIALIDGLVQGILSGTQRVFDAVSQVAGGAIAQAKQILGIASPSKVFAEIGGFVSEGFAVGAANDNSAQAAIAAMVAPPSFAAAGSAVSYGGSTANTSTGTHVEVHELHIHGASGSPEDIEAAVERALARVARQALLQSAA